MNSELQFDVRSGGAIWSILRGEGLVWLIGDGDVFAGSLPPVQLFVSTCSGRPHLSLQHHGLVPINCHFR